MRTAFKAQNSRKLFVALFALLMLVVPAQVMAQNSNILYVSSRNPHSNSVNPAFFPSRNRMFIALPCVNVDFTSPLSYSNIFTYNPGDTITTINVNNILDTLSHDGRIRLGTNVRGAAIGFRFGDNFLTASASANVNVGFSLPKGLLTLAKEGNYNYTGEDNYLELIDGQMLTLRAYGEGAIGFGRTFGKLTVGVRAKMLVGYYDFSMGGTSMRLYTGDDYNSLRADLDLQIHNASAVEINVDSTTNQISVNTNNINYFPNNRGFNFDLGVRYDNGLFELSASVIDLGKGIHWQDNVSQLVNANGEAGITFTGLSVDSLFVNGKMDSNYLNQYVDSLKAMTQFSKVDGADYWTTIPTKVNLAGLVNITPTLSAGIIFHGEFERGLTRVGDVFKTRTVGFYSSTSILGRINLMDWIEIAASFSVISNNSQVNWFNPGLGITLTPFRAIQVYAAMDYISNRYIIDAKQFNITAGVSLMFGNWR